MDYAIETSDHEGVARLKGRLIFTEHSTMRTLIKELSQSSAKRQVLVLEDLEFIDSAGIGMLLIAKEELTKGGKEFILRRANGQVQRVLKVAQLGRLITLEE